VSRNQTNSNPNSPQNDTRPQDSYGKIETSNDTFKRMAIPIAGSVVGFGAREAGIRSGLFTGVTQKKVEFTDPNKVKELVTKFNDPTNKDYYSVMGNLKNVDDSGKIVTLSQDALNKALVKGDIAASDIAGGVEGIKGLGGDMFGLGNIGNMAAGTLTGVAASMATNMAINAIRRRIQRNRERKQLLAANK
jgi:hypothetical protein